MWPFPLDLLTTLWARWTFPIASYQSHMQEHFLLLHTLSGLLEFQASSIPAGDTHSPTGPFHLCCIRLQHGV
jgi:hypothetical protein